jgi:hypothetical protein
VLEDQNGRDMAANPQAIGELPWYLCLVVENCCIFLLVLKKRFNVEAKENRLKFNFSCNYLSSQVTSLVTAIR